MTPALSPNTQAILLLTAPLIAGRGTSSSDLLSPGEYKRLARHLREIQRQPADLVSPDAADLMRACQPVIDEARLQRLLGRGFLLSQVIERWQARAIWVVSRADTEYPRRLKVRLREDAPAVIYGCGDMSLLESGGLAVVGSRHVDDSLIDYTMAVGRLAARAERTLVSGGAKGIDQAAMRGALEAGGKVSGVLADSLEKTTMNREHRNLLLDGQLVLISPYDPSAGFNVGTAMQRNKLIYALADAALVVACDPHKGGTWSGAIEQLDKWRLVPVFVRSTGAPSKGLEMLVERGARPAPGIENPDELVELLTLATAHPNQAAPDLFATVVQPQLEMPAETVRPNVGFLPAISLQVHDRALEQPLPIPDAGVRLTDQVESEHADTAIPADELMSTVRHLVLTHLAKPAKESEVAALLQVSNQQAKTWLALLVQEGSVLKLKKSAGFVAAQHDLFS